MRIAVLSDIHSNIQALTRAFEIIDESNIDKVYCLGDIVGYGGNPNECIELIRKRARAVVRGNHDQAIIDADLARSLPRPGRAACEWTRKHLSQENLQYLTSLPLTLVRSSFTLAHASPLHPNEWTYVMSLEVAEEQFKAFTTQVCFIGHTHVPAVCCEDMKTFEYRKSLRCLINVGSVGQPRDLNTRLSFGILDFDKGEYENVRADYDIEGASKAIRAAGLPRILGKRLFNGM
jgi:putative phosphoesterase